jgi:hypothetical protein
LRSVIASARKKLPEREAAAAAAEAASAAPSLPEAGAAVAGADAALPSPALGAPPPALQPALGAGAGGGAAVQGVFALGHNGLHVALPGLPSVPSPLAAPPGGLTPLAGLPGAPSPSPASLDSGQPGAVAAAAQAPALATAAQPMLIGGAP